MDLKAKEKHPIEYLYSLMIHLSGRRRPYALINTLARFIINLRATQSEEERLCRKVDNYI